MKILCVCEGGNCRSVAAGYILKTFYQHDALAAGWRLNSCETFAYLCAWADKIVLMHAPILEAVALIGQWEDKIVVMDVGPDRWGNALHPELQAILMPRIKAWHDNGYLSGLMRRSDREHVEGSEGIGGDLHAVAG